MTKAVVFDIGGVLINDPWPGMVKHYSQHFKITPDTFLAADRELADKWQTGKLTEAEFWRQLTALLNSKLPATESLWLAGFKAAYHEKNEVFKIIERLKKKGFKLALLTNTEVPIMNFLKEKKYKHFDEFVFSCQEKIAKPNKRIYIETVNRLDVKPEETIFIDDNEENVIGAQKAGLTGIKFENPEQLEEMLETLLN